MIKTIKNVLLSSISILAVSFFVWIIFLLNPNLSYANQIQVGQVTIYHNQDLEEETEGVITDAIKIIKQADIYDQHLNIQLCLNDDKIYPKLFPFAGATAYAFFNKAVMYDSEPDFKNNYTSFKWAINQYELRKYNLTRLLAHEFMHNFQHNHNPTYQITSTLRKINWKLEGHAEYISREFKHDGLLQEKITTYLIEEKKEQLGLPVFTLDDGTIQVLPYYKYALVIQYLMEIENLNFDQISELDPSLDKPYSEMLDWHALNDNSSAK